jgi:hypothetical protein
VSALAAFIAGILFGVVVATVAWTLWAYEAMK